MINGEQEIPPGSFRPSFEKLPKSEIKAKPIEAEPRPDLVAKYSLFKENFRPKADVVYHPCGANDVSPSAAFPDSRVIYVDIDEKVVEALKRGGFEAHVASALEFNPGEVDILIMLNPTISPDMPSSHVAENGFVLSNDYHGTASKLRQNGQYQLRAIIRTFKGGKLILDTEKLEDYWEEIGTEEEFKNAPFDWGAANYETAAQAVELVTGKRENVLAEYRKLIAKAREERRQKNIKTLQEHPELAGFLGNPDKDDLSINHGGTQAILVQSLPRKKGTVDDIFVFQKRNSTETLKK
ncbi:MAG: hypothetical protein Q7K35_06310 [bacterium]|nr:hypothetical protein [bacterium]